MNLAQPVKKSCFELYRPLRNYIKYFEVQESLEICWNFFNYLIFNKKIPNDIEFDNKLKHNFNPYLFRINVAQEWELEFLVSEFILNASTRVISKKKSMPIERTGIDWWDISVK